MKRIKILSIALIAILFGTIDVNASEDILTCLESSNGTCILTEDLYVDSEIEIGGNIALDLNGYGIRPNTSFNGDSLITVLRGGNLTIDDSSALKNGLISTGMNSKIYSAVKITKKGEEPGEAATLVVNGGTLEGFYYAIAGNGSRHNTSVTINDGKIVGLYEVVSYGIFNPQDGTVTINGGTITGISGIEMRAGELVVNGGTITGTGQELKSVKSASGSTTYGAGIAIAKHNTLKDIDIKISGGTISGVAAVYESNPNEIVDENQKVTITISGGKLTGTGDTVIASASDAITVNGGTFNKDVSDYLEETVSLIEDGDNYIALGMHNITVDNTISGKIETDKTTAGLGQTVTITSTPDLGFTLTELTVKDSQNNEIEVIDNKFIMPDDNVTITAVYEEVKIEVNITEPNSTDAVDEVAVGVKDKDVVTNVLLDSLAEDADLKEQSQKENLAVSIDLVKLDSEKLDENIRKAIEEKKGNGIIAEYIDISVNVFNPKDNTYIKSISELTEEIELMILLPKDLKNTNKEVNRKYFVIREHEGKVETIEAKLSEDGNYITVKSDKFSTYALAYEDTTNPKTGDDITLYVAASILSLCCLGVVIKTKKFD